MKETEKFNKFFKFVFKRSIKLKLFKILLNLEINGSKKFSYKIKKQNKKKIKEAIERYYKDVTLLRRYVALNFLIINKLMRKYKAAFEFIHMYDSKFIEKHNTFLMNSFVFQNSFKLKKILLALKQIYVEEFFPKGLEKRARQELEKIS